MVENNINNTKANKSLAKNKKLEEEVVSLRQQLEMERKRSTLLENQLFAMRSAQGGQHLLQNNFPHVSGPVQMGGHVSGGYVGGPAGGGGQTSSHMSQHMVGQQHNWGADTAALALSSLSQNQQVPHTQQTHQPHPHQPHSHLQHQPHYPQQQHPHMHNMHNVQNVFSVRDTY